MRIRQVENQGISLRDARLSHMTSLRTYFCMYGFEYSSVTVFVTNHPGENAKDVTTIYTDGMIVDLHVLNNGLKILLLDGRHLLKTMRQLQLESDRGWL